MNLTNLKAKPRFLLAVIVFAMTAGPLYGQQNDFEVLVNRFEEKGLVFHATFSHDYFDSYTGDTVSQKGELWIAKDKYRVWTNTQAVVVDGVTSKVYDEDRNRVIISHYDPAEDDFAPSRFLNGVDSTYTVEVENAGGGKSRIVLTSQDPFSLYQLVEIILNRDRIPLRIKATDAAENIIATQFNKGAFIPYKEGMFELSYPPNAEIVDMRNR